MSDTVEWPKHIVDAVCEALDCRPSEARAKLQSLTAVPAVSPGVTPEVAALVDIIRWAHDTLYEINPDNYDHDEVCKLNAASVEVILGLAPILGEKHGKTYDWWQQRTALDRLLAEAEAKGLQRAADELKGQGYNTAVRQVLALIPKEGAK